MKRLLDVLAAALGLALMLPLFLVIAACIWFEDRGPPFYRQRRVGRKLATFRMWKFRSMRVDADRIGGWSTADGDSRITRVGRLLRRTSLDELPQLINVLTGEMSLVGPRPYVEQQLSSLRADVARRRHAVLPGMTGLAQVSGRSSLSEEQTLALDLEYASSPSLGRYLSILFRTPAAVLGMRGTN